MTDITVPTLGESITEATVGQWLKAKGDAVKKDEVLVELETEKLSVEVSATEDGVLSEILANEGDTVEIGALLGKLGGGSGASAKSETAAAALPAHGGPKDPGGVPGKADKGELMDVEVPTMGESVAEGTLSTFLKAPGDAVKKDETIAEIETDKVALEVPSPADGIVAELLVGEGDSVTPGSLRNFFHKTGLTDKAKLENKAEEDLEWALSGSMMEHYIEGYFAGPAKFLTSVGGGLHAVASGGDFSGLSSKDIPLVRRFYASETSDWMTTKRFYDLRDRVLQANEYVKNLKRGKRVEEARKGMKVNANILKAKPIVDAVDTSRKALLRMENKIRSSGMSKEEIRHKVEEIRQKRLTTTRKALEKVRKLGLNV